MQTKRLMIGMLSAAMVFGTVACDGNKGKDKSGDDKAKADGAKADGGDKDKDKAPEFKAGPGVDVEKKTIKIAALNDLSGPGATIGKPFALGKQILVKQVNEEGMLPDGWKLELVEKDHGYNPQKSVQAFNEVKGETLMVATSFGTPNTLPLKQSLAKDKILAFPASLSSQMAEFEFTPPAAASYKLEAMRAVDFAVEDAGGADKVKLGIVYQQDDYGKDGIDGVKEAAKFHGIAEITEQTVAPGQKDVTAVVTALKDAGATHVVLTVLPSATGPIVGTAAQLKYMPKWLGGSPAWIDAFFSGKLLPTAVFANYHWVTGLPTWGEELEGMAEFVAAHEKYGEGADKDFYILISYIAGLAQVEALKIAIEKKDLTREGVLAALHTMTDFTANGMLKPSSFEKVPYVVNSEVRVLKPDFEKMSWAVLSDYATPKTMGGGEEKPADSPK